MNGLVTKEFLPERIPAEEVPLWNRIYRLNSDLTLTMAGEPFRLRFLPRTITPQAREGAPDGTHEAGWAFRISCEDIDLWICVKAGDIFLERLIWKVFGEELILGVPTEVRLAVFEVLLEELFHRFETQSGRKARLEQIAPADAVEGYEKRLPFLIYPSGSPERMEGMICFDDRSFPWFAQWLSTMPSTPAAVFHSIPLRGFWVVGRTRVPLKELRGLGRLDLIKLDEYYPSSGGRLLLHFQPGVAHWATRTEGGSQVVLQKRKEECVVTEGVVCGFEEVEVELRFDVGQHRIALKDLVDLKPGYVIDLQTPLDRAVTIRANGGKIGHGELVQIGSHMGVRILELYPNATDEPP